MNWTDIAGIVFVCVTVNHLGLIHAIEQTIMHEVPVLNCPKCLTFWTVLVYCICNTNTHIILMLAISLLCSYLAVWLELAEGLIDKLYNIAYDKIYPTESAADADTRRPEGDMPAMREEHHPHSTTRKGGKQA